MRISIACVVGDNVFLGLGVNLLNDKYPPSGHLAPVIIGDNEIVGGGSVILPTVKLGRKCVIGAGSVVTKNVPEGEVWWGNPARFHYKREEYDNEGIVLQAWARNIPQARKISVELQSPQEDDTFVYSLVKEDIRRTERGLAANIYLKVEFA